jgi:transcriptional regulator with XRE-family HTH domain
VATISPIVTQIVDRRGVEARLASGLREQRLAAGLSLRDLADRSGVSKAMIARVESGGASPTAGLLGRLCGGLGVTLSTLMRSIDEPASTAFRAAEQPAWKDPESGLLRTLLAPALRETRVEIAKLLLPGGAAVNYPFVPARAIRQHIVMLSGRLRFTAGNESTDLGPGDCLFAVIDRPTRLEAIGPAPAEYLVIQETM